MIDWKSKLTSRKLWLSIAGFVAMLVVYFTGNESQSQQITALIMAGATIIGYAIGEGLSDTKDVYSNISYDDMVYDSLPADAVLTSEDGEIEEEVDA